MENLYRLDVMAAKEEDQELLSAILAREVTGGWEELTGQAGLVFRVYADNPLFLERLQGEIASNLNAASFNLDKIDQKDWMDAWRDFFTPVICGDRFVVLPPWLANENYPGRTKILIEPASAFGTGHHATTALCLSALGDLFDKKYLQPGRKFLDLGCGSGILGIGACLCGMTGLGLDTDIVAIENASKNRQLNHAEKLSLIHGSLEKAKKGEYDIIMTNILATPLIDMADEICACLKPDALLMLSGILTRQADEVIKKYAQIGKKLIAHNIQDEWSQLLFS